jgi:hypothetical protein
MRRTYDVIVVGTRGAPLAMLLARKGYRVLVVSALSPAGTSVGAMAALERWGLGERFETLLVDAAILAGAEVRSGVGVGEMSATIVVDAAQEIQDVFRDAEPRAKALDETLRGGQLQR